VKRSQPDVVLCDLGLPDGVSGFDVARDLRADPETRTLPVVALTGYGRSEDKQAGMEAGFDAHLTKPVEADTLDRLLARLERSRRHDT
jgi:CheY-like chemotaxis protein